MFFSERFVKEREREKYLCLFWGWGWGFFLNHWVQGGQGTKKRKQCGCGTLSRLRTTSLPLSLTVRNHAFRFVSSCEKNDLNE